MRSYALVLLGFVATYCDFVEASASTITVHVCPSTHMDPGWMATVDELYNDYFRETINNVTKSLGENPSRTYSAEIAVIWAMHAAEVGPEALRRFVASGQLQFVGGGWVQPDEAITRFEDLIEQQTLGHMWLRSVLGHPPVRVGYSADPFGHSNTFAYITALNAYDAHILGRPMSPHDPINSMSHAIWHPLGSAPDAGHFDASSSVLTSDNQGYWEPYRSMLGPMLKHNVGAAADVLLQWVSRVTAQPPFVQNVIVILGDDAPLQAPFEAIFPVLDQVIDALNRNSSMSIFQYSTPAAYVQALAAEAKTRGLSFSARPAWDMVPLVGNEFPYWTGYYTSRPELKQVVHSASSFLRSASMLHALAMDARTWFGGASELLTLSKSVSLAQHHDIITGDCFDAVAEDTMRQLRTSISNSARAASVAAAILTGVDDGDAGVACFNTTLSPCAAVVAALEARSAVALSVFNGLAWPTVATVSLIVPSLDPAEAVIVTDSAGSVVASQMGAFAQADLSAHTNWSSLVFAHEIAPLAIACFTLRVRLSSPHLHADDKAQNQQNTAAEKPWTLSNGLLDSHFSPNGSLLSICVRGTCLAVIPKVLFYTSKPGSENAWYAIAPSHLRPSHLAPSHLPPSHLAPSHLAGRIAHSREICCSAERSLSGACLAMPT
jgi:hypothetical protein